MLTALLGTLIYSKLGDIESEARYANDPDRLHQYSDTLTAMWLIASVIIWPVIGLFRYVRTIPLFAVLVANIGVLLFLFAPMAYLIVGLIWCVVLEAAYIRARRVWS